jgi:hypothetical protein
MVSYDFIPNKQRNSLPPKLGGGFKFKLSAFEKKRDLTAKRDLIQVVHTPLLTEAE